jgi:hypothetical protein
MSSLPPDVGGGFFFGSKDNVAGTVCKRRVVDEQQ